jgi:probable HAF family extracellular repeat protein
MKTWRRIAVIAATLLALLAAVSAAGAETYRVTVLGPAAGGGYIFPTGLNNSGHVVGLTSDDAYPSQTGVLAFQYKNGSFQILESLAGRDSHLAGVNDAGTVVGTITGDDFRSHVFVFRNGSVEDLGTLGGFGAFANGVNNQGHIVGGLGLSEWGDTHAFLYKDGQVTDLGTLGGRSSWASAINDRGQVVGTSYLDDWGLDSHAFLWQDGVMRDLGGSNSFVSAVNDRGVVVGSAAFDDGLSSHAVRWVDGRLDDLGTLRGLSTLAADVNNAGLIVGSSYGFDAEGLPLQGRGFLYRDGTLRDLNDLIGAGSGWTITGAFRINDLGQIAAVGTDGDGLSHALLLSPEPVGEAPEPASIVLLGLGVATVGAYAWRYRRGSRRNHPEARP